MKIKAYYHIMLAIFSVALMSSCTKQDDSARLSTIDKLYSSGRFVEAEDQISQYLEKYPESSQGHALSGWILIKRENLDGANSEFLKTITIDNLNDNAYVGLGVIARKKGDLSKARDYYKKSLEINQENPEAYGSLVVVELMCGNYRESINLATKSMQYKFDDPTLYANASVAYHYIGNMEERDKFFELAKAKGYLNSETLLKIFANELEIPVQECSPKQNTQK